MITVLLLREAPAYPYLGMAGTARIFAVHIGSLCYAFDKGAQKLDNAELKDTEPDCLEERYLYQLHVSKEEAFRALR